MRRLLLVEIGAGLNIVGDPPALILDVPVSFSFQGYGGTLPYTWAPVSGQPPGMVWDRSSATLSGTPTTPGSYTITVTLKDGQRDTITRPYTFTVAALPLTISGDAPNGTIGVPYSYSYTSAGGVSPRTYSIFAGSLPDGLSLNASTGALSGTPTVGDSFAWTVRVTDNASPTPITADLVDSATVSLATLTLTGTYAAAFVGIPYSSDLAIAGGDGTYSLTGGTGVVSGSLPAGLSLSIVGSAMRLSGTPTTVATSGFTAGVGSGDGQSATSAQSVGVTTRTYATWNPLDASAFITLSNGNKSADGYIGPANYEAARATTGISARPIYFEITAEQDINGFSGIVGMGTAATPLSSYVGADATSNGIQIANGGRAYLARATAFDDVGAAYVGTQVTQHAIDPVNGKGWIGVVGHGYYGGGDPAAGTSPTYTFTPAAIFPMTSHPFFHTLATLNAGDSAFAGTVPAGFDGVYV